MKIAKDNAKVKIQALIFRLFQKRFLGKILHVGENYGAWFYINKGTNPLQCVLIGAGEDISLELHLIESKHNCLILDPTPRSISYLESKLPNEGSNFKFLPVGISDFDGNMRFYFPKDPTHVSLSALNLQKTSNFIELPVITISTLLLQLNIKHIDLLKLDIEGMSPRVITDMLNKGIYPNQILTDLEFPVRTSILVSVLLLLRKKGYKLVFRRNRDCLFVRNALL